MRSELVVGRMEHVRPARAERAHAFGYPWFGVMVRYPIEPLGRWFSHNRFGFLSFDDRDHGDRDGSDPLVWLQRELDRSGVPLRVEEVTVEVLTMPRVLGRVFNPVSFWYLSQNDELVCVVAEVNNTFEGTHPYVLYQDGAPLDPKGWLDKPKVFYVSPFFPVQGVYRFRFRHGEEQTDVRLHFVDEEGQLQIATRVGGDRLTMSPQAILKASFRAFLGVWMALVRIHWHALILYVKGVQLVPRDRGHGRPIRADKQFPTESEP